MEQAIEILGRKAKIASIKGCPAGEFYERHDTFVIWIELADAFDDGTLGFGVRIPAHDKYTKAELLQIIKSKAEKHLTENLQRHQDSKAKEARKTTSQCNLDTMVNRLVEILKE